MMKSFRKFILLFYFIFKIHLNAEVLNGLILFSPYYSASSKTLLISNDQTVFHIWQHEEGPSSIPYLLPDSSIIYPYRVQNPSMLGGGVGGGIQKLKWDGTVIWDYVFSNHEYQHHHDIEILPNGNIILIVWERKSAEEAYAIGRQSIENTLNELWVPALLELEPETGNIIWEWHIWDHLIQNIDASLFNYGVISEHPELMNINYGSAGGNVGDGADWMHINSIDYNPQLDQIVVSSRNMNEFYIIDHSTTIEEASQHDGGLSGKGGDFLFRWGNPIVYQRGDIYDQKLYGQHDVNWIEPGYPGDGSLILFNNGRGRPGTEYSSIDVITPMMDDSNNYYIPQESALLPDDLSWTFHDNKSFYSPRQSGSQRLSNGNTLITIAYSKRIIEVSLEGNIIWDYSLNDNSIGIPRAMKYEFDFFNNNNLKLNNKNLVGNFKVKQNFPNPFNPFTNLTYELPKESIVRITIFDMLGNVVKSLIDQKQSSGIKSIRWDGKNNQNQPVASGVYPYQIMVGNHSQTKMMILLK